MAELDFYMHIYGTKDAVNVEELSSADVVVSKHGKQKEETTMEKLRPCPFCGFTRPNLRTTLHDLPGSGVKFEEPLAIVTCPRCCAAAGFYKINEKQSEEEACRKAIRAWNMRDYEEDDDGDC